MDRQYSSQSETSNDKLLNENIIEKYHDDYQSKVSLDFNSQLRASSFKNWKRNEQENKNQPINSCSPPIYVSK